MTQASIETISQALGYKAYSTVSEALSRAIKEINNQADRKAIFNIALKSLLEWHRNEVRDQVFD